MRSNYLKTLKTAVLAISVLLLGVASRLAQQQVNLTAGPANATLPDGSIGADVGLQLRRGRLQLDCHLRRVEPGCERRWSPVVITVPTGQDLQINLTNNLSFTPLAAEPPTRCPRRS